MPPEFFQTRTGVRFYEVQLPRLTDMLAKLSTKQTACNLIAAGIHAGNEDMTPDGAARKAVETYEAIERKLS